MRQRRHASYSSTIARFSPEGGGTEQQHEQPSNEHRNRRHKSPVEDDGAEQQHNQPRVQDPPIRPLQAEPACITGESLLRYPLSTLRLPPLPRLQHLAILILSIRMMVWCFAYIIWGHLHIACHGGCPYSAHSYRQRPGVPAAQLQAQPCYFPQVGGGDGQLHTLLCRL
eukprot:1158822-Pelagomonas_calceolata.AAC.2